MSPCFTALADRTASVPFRSWWRTRRKIFMAQRVRRQLRVRRAQDVGWFLNSHPQSNGSWTETVLYTFCSQSNCADGERPADGPLVLDAAGNLYGTTYFGGAYSNCNRETCGTLRAFAPVFHVEWFSSWTQLARKRCCIVLPAERMERCHGQGSPWMLPETSMGLP